MRAGERSRRWRSASGADGGTIVDGSAGWGGSRWWSTLSRRRLFVLAIVLLFTADPEQIVGFSSLVFLLVFAVVNGAALRHRVFRGWQRVLPAAGGSGCLGAVAALGARMWQEEPGTLPTILGIAGLLLLLRAPFEYLSGSS